MDLHQSQLNAIKVTSKYDELRKKGHFIDSEFKKLQSKLKESTERSFELTVADAQGMSENTLTRVETQLFKGIQRINQERGQRA